MKKTINLSLCTACDVRGIVYVQYSDTETDRAQLIAWAYIKRSELISTMLKKYRSLRFEDGEDVFQSFASKVINEGLTRVLGKIKKSNLEKSGLSLEEYLQARYRKNLSFSASRSLRTQQALKRGGGATHINVDEFSEVIAAPSNYDVECSDEDNTLINNLTLMKREKIFLNVLRRAPYVIEERRIRNTQTGEWELKFMVNYDLFFDELDGLEKSCLTPSSYLGAGEDICKQQVILTAHKAKNTLKSKISLSQSFLRKAG